MATRDERTTGDSLRLVRADIDAGTLARVYLFHGEEGFLLRRFAEALARKALAPGAETVDRVVFDPEGRPSALDLRRLAAEVATPPFLSPRRFVLVRNSGLFAAEPRRSVKETPDGPPAEGDDEDAAETPAEGSSKDRGESLAKLLDSVPDSACLVFCEKKADRRMKKPFEAVERNGRVVEFPIQKTEDLRVFVGREFAAASIAVDADAVDSILVRSGCSLQTITSECEKLRLRCQGEGLRRVTAALVEETCVPDLAGQVFDLADAIGAGRPDRALRILDVLSSRREPVQVLLFLLARHVRLLLVAKETPDRARLAARLNLPPFIAGKYADQARGFTAEALESLHARCFEADFATKSGRLPDRDALEALIASVPPRAAPVRRPG